MTERLRVLVTAPYFQPVVDRFRAVFEEHRIDLVVPPVTERLEAHELMPLVGEVHGVISGDDRFTREVLESARRLRVIAKWGTGIDSIDREACADLGISVRNTPGAFTQPVSDSILGYMLCFARALPAMDARMKAGHWTKQPGRTLDECTVGIIGLGAIGTAVARKAAAFQAELLAHDVRRVSDREATGAGVSVVPLETLLETSDFVCVTCDLNPTSHRLIGRSELHSMKETAVLINLARGPIVHEAALIEALANGSIAGAALDVFEDEPLPESSPLRRMANVMLAPHNANSSPSAWERVHLSTVANLLEGLEG